MSPGLKLKKARPFSPGWRSKIPGKVKLIDSHAHLDDEQFEPDLSLVMERAREAGLVGIVSVGTSLESSTATVRLAQKYDLVYAAVGVHPHEVDQMKEEELDELARLAKSEKVKAIGEVGLDFYRDYSPRPVQIERFRQQVELAKKLKLPLLVHDRNAHQETLGILKETGAKEIGGVLHCFSGDEQLARQAAKLGFLISFAGNITFENAARLRDAARNIPLEHVLVETDCPYLTPEPPACSPDKVGTGRHRGERNEPAYVKYVAQALADLHGLSLEDVARITTGNAARLLGLESLPERAKIAYQIRKSLYLNITNDCTLECSFCAKRSSYTVKGHYLRLEKEPTAQEILEVAGDPARFSEVVFCGYGEPLLRLDRLIQVAKELKKKGARLRIDTDGLANLVHGRNILPELTGLIDSISVSLNADSAAKYARLCPSPYGQRAYGAVKDFILEAKKHIPEVMATVVAVPGLDVEACRHIAEKELGVKFRARKYNEVG